MLWIFIFATSQTHKSMKIHVWGIFAILFFINSCKTAPLTGRRQLLLVPNSELMSMSFAQYGQVKNNSRIITGTAQARMVENAGKRIQKAIEIYMAEKGLSNRLNGFEWEYILIDEDIVNAWCMPGGKIAFYTGIMPVCKDETGVAVVIGHEIAHAIANHGNERMSSGLVQAFGGAALAVAMRDKPAETQALFLGAYGAGTTVGVMLPFSRRHESEADELGLMFMALAGYDPREAPKFWERMSALSGGNKPPEMLSTHPSDTRRINDLNKHMPRALAYYNKSK